MLKRHSEGLRPLFLYYAHLSHDEPHFIVAPNRNTRERMERTVQLLGYVATAWCFGGGPDEPQIVVLCQTETPPTEADRGNISESIIQYLIQQKLLRRGGSDEGDAAVSPIAFRSVKWT